MIGKRKRRAMAPEAALVGVPESQRAPKLGLMDKLGALGGLMTDFSGNTSGAFAMQQDMNRDKLARMVRQQEEEKRAKLIQQAMGGVGAGGMQPAAAPGGAGGGGISPQDAASWQLDPAAMIAHRNAMEQQAAKPMEIGQGNSVWQNGGFAGTASQNFQNGSQIARMGGDGSVSHMDMGMNADNRVTAQGNALDNIENLRTTDASRYGSDSDRYVADQRLAGTQATAGAARMGHQLGYEADMAKVGLGEAELQHKQDNPEAGRTFNQAQAQAAGYGSRASAANNDYGAFLAETGFDPTRPGWRNVPLVGGRLGNGDARQEDAIKREFVNAVLRKESGAAISNSEYNNAERMFFPAVGDDEATIRQKEAARARAIQSMRAESQGASDALFGDQGATPQGGPQVGAVEDGYRYMGGDPRDPNSWQAVR